LFFRYFELKQQRKLMQQYFNESEKRFEQTDNHFDTITRRIDNLFIFSYVGITVSAEGIIIATLKLWPT
jgi:hypothetical protein